MIDVSGFPKPRGIADLLQFDRIGVFGATGSAFEVEALLAEHGKHADVYFDNDASKHGTTFGGREVHPAAKAVEFANAGGAVVIAAAYQIEIGTQLRDLGVSRAQVFPFVSRMFARHFGREAVAPFIDRINGLLRRVADDASRAYLRDLVRFRWTMDPLDLHRNPLLKGMYHYDNPALGPLPGSHIVDCGAYTGDTAEIFLSRLGGNAVVTAIEPLSRNYAALAQWIAEQRVSDRVTAIRAAVGSEVGTVAIQAGDDPADPRARVGHGSEQVTVETLDHLFDARFGEVDYIKVDIEGFELEALKGATRLLRTRKPDLALAGYHKREHLWEIPEMLDQIQPGYEIFVGHHPSAPYECEFYCSCSRLVQ